MAEAVEYYACASSHKVAIVECVEKRTSSYEVHVYDVKARPYHYGTFGLEKIAKHMFDSRERALNALSWHGVVWFRVDDCEDVIEAAARLFCAEVV